MYFGLKEDLFQDAEKVSVGETIRMVLVVGLDMGGAGAQGFSMGWWLKVAIYMVMLIYLVS